MRIHHLPQRGEVEIASIASNFGWWAPQEIPPPEMPRGSAPSAFRPPRVGGGDKSYDAPPFGVHESFDVLNLLAKLVDHSLHRQPNMGELNVRRFRAQRIGLTVKFLCKKIELTPGRLAAGDERPGLLAMGGQAVQFFPQIGSGGQQSDFLGETVLRKVRARRQQLLELSQYA